MPKRKPHCSTLEAHKETPVFILVDMTEDVVELVALKLLESTRPSGTKSEVLQGWLLKLGDRCKKNCISVESFVDLRANQNSPWAAYNEFMSVILIELDKIPAVIMVGVGENWR